MEKGKPLESLWELVLDNIKHTLQILGMGFGFEYIDLKVICDACIIKAIDYLTMLPLYLFF